MRSAPPADDPHHSVETEDGRTIETDDRQFGHRYVGGGSVSFLSSLKPATLLKAREIVKRVHMQHYPNALITDREADRIIDALGPEVLERVMEEAARE